MPLSRLPLAGAALALLAACHPNQPTAERPPTARPAAAASMALLAPPLTPPTDAFGLPGEQIAELRPATAVAFARLDSASSLAATLGDTADRPLPASVRRVGRSLLLSPSAGPMVRLRTTLTKLYASEADHSRRYQYLGSLPAAHQWAVLESEWAATRTLLIDQRTGRRLAVSGSPAASPKGSFVLAASTGRAACSECFNGLSLVRIDPSGPRLLWQRELAATMPVRARWAGPGRWLLQALRPAPAGDSTSSDDTPQYDYLELSLPTAAASNYYKKHELRSTVKLMKP